jgi:hypothetical protein
MTLIIDMATGMRCDDPVDFHLAKAAVDAVRLEAPAAETGLTLVPSTATTTPVMPASLRACELETFLNRMRITLRPS